MHGRDRVLAVRHLQVPAPSSGRYGRRGRSPSQTRRRPVAKGFFQAIFDPVVADIFTASKRSKIMSSIRSKGNRSTELRLARLFREHGITGWRRHQRLPGSPDFVFRRERVAIFVDGCFWHGCPKHGTQPKDNARFWSEKLNANKRRDLKVTRQLQSMGWKVLRIWEHALKDAKRTLARCRAKLLEQRCSTSKSPPRTGPCDDQATTVQTGSVRREK